MTKPEEVELLLKNVAQHFLGHFAPNLSLSLTVECDPTRPTAMVSYRRLFNTGHKVILTTHDYCAWSFQFAHELCHVVSCYHRLRADQNLWFHESMCDLASFFTIKQMSSSWSRIYPAPWAWFSIAIQDYAGRLLANDEFQLPTGAAFSDWFKINEPSLRIDRYQRTKNGIIALRLLPLMEENPQNWEVIRFFPDCGESFATFLYEWENNCPASLKPFVVAVADVFDVRLPWQSS